MNAIDKVLAKDLQPGQRIIWPAGALFVVVSVTPFGMGNVRVDLTDTIGFGNPATMRMRGDRTVEVLL